MKKNKSVLIVSILVGISGYAACWQSVNDVCAGAGSHYSITVPSGMPCAGQQVTITVQGNWLGPTAALGSPGGDTPALDPQNGCTYWGTYSCNGQSPLIQTTKPGIKIVGYSC